MVVPGARSVARLEFDGAAADLRLTLGAGTARVSSPQFFPDGGVLLVAKQGAAAHTAFAARAPSRRVVDLCRLDIETTWPFHLVRRTRSVELPMRVYVHPKLTPRRRDADQQPGDGGRDARWQGQGGSLRQLRDYVEGDSPKSIHWRSTARHGRLIVREDHAEARPEVVVQAPAADSSTFEQELSRAASECRDALAAGADVTLRGNSAEYHHRGRAGLRRAMRWFAAVAPSRKPEVGVEAQA